eukprot:2709781-Pleurochrysis_carterae.AAC.1
MHVFGAAPGGPDPVPVSGDYYTHCLPKFQEAGRQGSHHLIAHFKTRSRASLATSATTSITVCGSTIVSVSPIVYHIHKYNDT